MIYCVIPEALADELLDKMEAYYSEDPNVEVIVDRRRTSRRQGGADATLDSEQRQLRDRRRRRLVGELPQTESAE